MTAAAAAAYLQSSTFQILTFLWCGRWTVCSSTVAAVISRSVYRAVFFCAVDFQYWAVTAAASINLRVDYTGTSSKPANWLPYSMCALRSLQWKWEIQILAVWGHWCHCWLPLTSYSSSSRLAKPCVLTGCKQRCIWFLFPFRQLWNTTYSFELALCQDTYLLHWWLSEIPRRT